MPGRGAALDRAVRLLGRRDHSVASLRAKLARAGLPTQEVEEAVETLVRAGYLDDFRFAQGRAEHLASRGYGDDWIRADLDSQGVPGDPVQEAIAALPPERQRALTEAARRSASPSTARALQRRGFSEGSIEAVLAQAVADHPPAGVG
jgi:regulatory protein